MMGKYQDADGNPRSLHSLCVNEPAWAVSRIERLTAEGERQKQFISLVQWIITKGYDDPESMIRRIRFELALLTDNVDSASGKQTAR